MKIGWFSPVSAKTGIATYSQNVLEEMKRLYPREDLDVVVYHPPTEDETLEMPYPAISLSDSLLASDFHALFDVAVYHLGNNSKNHDPIYAALMQQPGVVVMHDYVYQHYLAEKSVENNFVGPTYGNLVFSRSGPDGFNFLKASQVLRCDAGQVAYVPWESDWAVNVPFCDMMARLGVGAVVHSDYARRGLGDDYPSPVGALFMPRPEVPEKLDRPISLAEGSPIHIVFCGHIGSTKGLNLLTTAFSNFPRLREQFRVTIAGFDSDPHFMDTLKTILVEQNLQNTFNLRIGLNEEAFQTVLSRADVFFNLRYPNTEGASLSLLEQLAFGRPVIAYRTGCFAEIPDEAAYFLDRIGDADELADVLHQIASERDELVRRGAAARAAVENHTAATYARDIVTFLKDNKDLFQHRAGIVTSRRDDATVASVDSKDRMWMETYADCHHLLHGTYHQNLYLPTGFFDASALEKGQLVALNLLHSRIPEDRCLKLGELLEDLDMLEMHHLIGRLILLSLEPQKRQKQVPDYLGNVYLPDFDPNLWRVLALLEPHRAVPMALTALGKENGDPSMLIKDVRRKGFRSVMKAFITDEDICDLSTPDHEPLKAFFSVIDRPDLKTLIPLPYGENVLTVVFESPDSSLLLTEGFHDIENIGIWSCKKTAALYFRTDPDMPLKKVSGAVSMLIPSTTNKATVEITLTEISSGKQKTTTVTTPASTDTTPKSRSSEQLTWSLNTKFSGALCLNLVVENLHSPFDLDISEDKRQLGTLLHSLTLEN